MPDLATHLDQLFYLATLAYDQDRFAAAAELLSPYVRHRPGHGYAWFVYGDALRVLGLFHEAERALVRSQELCPNQPWPRVRLGMVKEQLGHRDAAEADYAAVADRPDVAGAGWFWVVRGGNLAAMNQLAQAEACHRTALACDDVDRAEAYLNLGTVLRAAGRYAAAAEAFRQARESSVGSPAADVALAEMDGVEEAVRLAAATPG